MGPTQHSLVSSGFSVVEHLCSLGILRLFPLNATDRPTAGCFLPSPYIPRKKRSRGETRVRNPPPFLQIRKKIHRSTVYIILFSSSPCIFSSLANSMPTPVMKAQPLVSHGRSAGSRVFRLQLSPPEWNAFLCLCLLPCPNCHCCCRRRTMVSLAYLSVDLSPHLVVVRRSSFDVIFSLLFLCLWKFRKRKREQRNPCPRNENH